MELLVSDLGEPKMQEDITDLISNHKVVDQAAWQRINEAEIATGESMGKPRVKSVRRSELLNLAGI